MYKFEKELNLKSYEWGKNFELRICFFPSHNGCNGMGAVKIRLSYENENGDYTYFFKDTKFYLNNYLTCKTAIQSFFDTYQDNFDLEDGRRLHEILSEAFGGCVLSMTDKELEF